MYTYMMFLSACARANMPAACVKGALKRREKATCLAGADPLYLSAPAQWVLSLIGT